MMAKLDEAAQLLGGLLRAEDEAEILKLVEALRGACGILRVAELVKLASAGIGASYTVRGGTIEHAFYVSGTYKRKGEEVWTAFETGDLFFGDYAVRRVLVHVGNQFSDRLTLRSAVDQAIAVVDWRWREQGWEAIEAQLFLDTGVQDAVVYQWTE